MNRRGPLIVGAIAGVVSVLLIFFLVLPKKAEVAEAKKQLSTAEEQEQELQLQLQQLRAAQADAPQATEEIRRLEELVPPTADLPGLILLLSGAANDAGVDLFTMAPGTPTPGTNGQFSVIPTQVTVTGSYFAIEEFLFNVETLQRAGKVLSLSLAPGGGEDGDDRDVDHLCRRTQRGDEHGVLHDEPERRTWIDPRCVAEPGGRSHPTPLSPRSLIWPFPLETSAF